jgi:basic membrane lipoprotein Med (substrate-binding protein (PBP1-ABC) superfamily)
LSSETNPHSQSNPPAWRLLLAFILVLAACTSPAPTRTPAPTTIQGTAVTAASSTPSIPATATLPPAPTDTAAPPPFTVGYAADGAATTPGILDEIQAMAQQLSWVVQTQTDGITAISALAQAGANVVVADGAALEEATRQAAIAFPQTYFIGVNQESSGDELANLLVLGSRPAREDQLGFMAGVVAGFVTQAEVVTAVSYSLSPAGLKYRNGFLHGVRFSCSRCRVDFVDVADINSDAAAVERARLNASLSSDVVFAAAGATGIEALRAAAAQGAWLIGSESDVYNTAFGGSGAEADHVLASVFFDPAAAVGAALAAYHTGSPWTGSRPYSAAIGAVALAPFRVAEEVLSELDRTEIAAILALLASGELDTGIDPLTGNEL